MKKNYVFIFLLCLSCNHLREINSQGHTYFANNTEYAPVIYKSDSYPGKRPGILLVPNWMGIAPAAAIQAEKIAKLGYIVYVVDVYGKDIRPKSKQDAMQAVVPYKKDRLLFQKRLQEALEDFRKRDDVDTNKIIAIGYCFGGTGVLELARSGADVLGVVSFHGGIDSLHPEQGSKIRAKVLVLHGADDPFVKQEDIRAFEAEMKKYKIDWQLFQYGNAVHSFTDTLAGNDNTKGAAYNELADLRSFKAFQQFAKDLF